MARRPWHVGIVIAGMLGLAASVGLLAIILRVKDLQTAANVAQLISVVLVIPSLAAGLLLWLRRSTKPKPPTAANVAEAKDALADSVAEQWKIEATLRSLDDPDPIPVQWRLSEHDELMDHPSNIATGTLIFTGSSEQIGGLTEKFRTLRRRRLVILGGPGTGKTTLAVQILRQLLATRQEREPVPVLLSIASWDTNEFPRLHDWLAMRLGQDYPGLRGTPLRDDAPRVLAARGHVLPILDGLDELPNPVRAAVITALNRSMGDADQLILTSRVDEFAAAVRTSGKALTSAAVIEPLPLAANVVADYLTMCLPRRPGPVWQQILNSLRSKDPSAAALSAVASTPLGLWLLRSVYIAPGADPAQLLDADRFPTAAKVQAHLLDQLIPAVVATRPPSNDPAELFRPRQRLDPDQVTRWLAYLADHLSRIPTADAAQTGTRDFAWWQLARHAVDPHVLRLAAGRVFGMIVGLIGLSIGIVGAIPTSGDLVLLGLPRRLVLIVPYGCAGLTGGFMWGLTAPGWSRDPPGFINLRLNGRIRDLIKTITLFAIVFGLLVGLTIGLIKLAEFPIGLGVGIVYGLTIGLTYWMQEPTRADHASTPMANWQADRTLTLAKCILWAVMFAALAALLGGRLLQFPPVLHLLVMGAMFGVVAALCFVPLGGSYRAWLAYVVATHYLKRKNLLPRRFMPFLDDCHRLGLLRAVGPIYQFRHAEFQDHLAAKWRSGGSVDLVVALGLR